MMGELQEIVVVIDPQGNVEARVKGVQGTSCVQLTEEMFQRLGSQVIRQELTDEYRSLKNSQESGQGMTIDRKI
jgi:hypothetical protein